jgi:anti-sigma factor RsiW
VADQPAHPPCLKVLELLPRFIEDDFSPEESEEIRAHLKDCEACQKEVDAMRRLVDTLETIPTLDVPSSFKEAVMKHLPSKPDAR